MDLGRFLLLFGTLLVGVGALLTCAGKIPWIGRLPGDIFYEGEHVTVYVPLATCALISAGVTLLLFFLRR